VVSNDALKVERSVALKTRGIGDSPGPGTPNEERGGGENIF